MEFTADFNDTFWEPPESEYQPLLDFESEISDEVPHNDISVLTQRIKRSFLDYVRQGIMLDAVRRYRLYKRQYQDFADYCKLALGRSAKLQDDLAPLLWGWLAGRRKSKKYDRILAATIGSGIEPQTQWAAKQYCEIEEEIFKLKKQLVELIDSSQFEEYRLIFTKFGFGYQLQGYLLGAIYPIEDFLKDGQPEVKIRKNRQTGKESKLKLSERRFMRAVGMGVVREDSGQKKKGKQSGSALCRKGIRSINRGNSKKRRFTI